MYLRDIIEPSAFQRLVTSGAESPLLTHADETPCHVAEEGLEMSESKYSHAAWQRVMNVH